MCVSFCWFLGGEGREIGPQQMVLKSYSWRIGAWQLLWQSGGRPIMQCQQSNVLQPSMCFFSWTCCLDIFPVITMMLLKFRKLFELYSAWFQMSLVTGWETCNLPISRTLLILGSQTRLKSHAVKLLNSIKIEPLLIQK